MVKSLNMDVPLLQAESDLQLLPHPRDQRHLQPAELCQLLWEGAGGQPHPGWWDLPGTDMVFSSYPTPEIDSF
jgi:hypothetical protein